MSSVGETSLAFFHRRIVRDSSVRALHGESSTGLAFSLGMTKVWKAPLQSFIILAVAARCQDVSGADECSGNKDFGGKPAGEIMRSTRRPNHGGKTRNKSAAGPSRLRCIPRNQPE